MPHFCVQMDRIPSVEQHSPSDRPILTVGPNRIVCRTFELDGDTGGIVSEVLLLKVERTCTRRRCGLLCRTVGIGRTGSQVAPMYRRLPHGPSGMERDEVARN